MFRDFRLLHGAAEAISLTDVTQPTICCCLGTLWARYNLPDFFLCFSMLKPALVTPIPVAVERAAVKRLCPQLTAQSRGVNKHGGGSKTL